MSIAATVFTRVCLKGITVVNRIFLLLVTCLQAIVLPQVSAYQFRVYTVYIAQFFSCDLMVLSIVKALQVYFNISNFALLLSISSVLPYLRAVYQLWSYIPCPPLASAISNVALLLALVLLLGLGIGTYAQISNWTVYTYVMIIWPWLVMLSMSARLYTERQVGKNPLSPVRELPLIGLMSAVSLSLSIVAVKDISISDCIVLLSLDPVIAAVFASVLLGSERRKLHFQYVRAYAVMLGFVAIFGMGEQGPGVLQVQAPTLSHLYFALARLLVVGRSILVKWLYISHSGTQSLPKPTATQLLFYRHDKPRKHRFNRFPSPVLFTLDAIFDSGLRDSEMHAMGPLGTEDLLVLTEGTYLLPISSLLAWMSEYPTLPLGALPNNPAAGQERTAQDAALQATAATKDQAILITEEFSTADMVIAVCLVFVLCVSVVLRPWAAAKTSFDRASATGSWWYQPVLVAMPFFLADILFLNEAMSKFQIAVVLALAFVIIYFRSDLWDNFRKRSVLLSTQELHYYQPAVMRQLQQRTLLEFFHKTSTDDYDRMLCDTAVRHGANIRELARDTSVIAWDPAPSAKAAWKLATSLVLKDLNRKKLLRKKQQEQAREHETWIANMVLEAVYNAVDQAAGHGVRLRVAGSVAAALAKRRAVRRLRALAQGRRTLRHKRKTGQLAIAPAHLATACGAIRSIRDMKATQATSPAAPLPALPPPPKPLADGSVIPYWQQGHMHMSLTRSSRQAGVEGNSNTPSMLSMPGELLTELPSPGASPLAGVGGDGIARGIVAGSNFSASRAVSAVVLAFGDGRRGQLGQDQGASRGPASNIAVVEELRAYEPVQVEAAGVASFVVNARGQMWGFGSNRAVELGMRKEVAQVNQPQRVKALREQVVVQVAGSCSASGQAHTLALTAAGEVYCFGTSSCGALGQGSEVRQTAPLLLRLTTQVSVRTVCVGACHSLLVTDNGKLYAMGDNRHGQLGLARRDRGSASEPALVQGPLESRMVRVLAAGDDHTLAATDDGQLYAWGANASGQLGLSRVDDQIVPQPVRELQDANIVSLACGARHSLVVADSGSQLWAFGSNVQGQLGTGHSGGTDGFQLTYPAVCRTLSRQHMMELVQVAAASSHSLALTKAGELYGWGDNTYGQIGFPTGGLSGQQRVLVPKLVSGLSRHRVHAVATADMHSLALAT